MNSKIRKFGKSQTMFPRPLSDWLATGVFFGLLFLVWHFSVSLGFVPPYIMPTPRAVWDAAITVMTDGYPFGVTLWTHAAHTLRLALLGFSVGAGLAILLALPIGWYPPLRSTIEPVVALFRGIPALAWIPIAILLFGIGDASKISIIIYGTFWIMLTHCLDGMKRIDPIFIRAARTLGASTPQILTTIVLPASLPAVFTGLRVGYAVSFGVVLSAEMVGAFRGLGFLIQDARDLLRSDLVIVGMIGIGTLGYVTAWALFSIEHVLIRWRPVSRDVVIHEG